VNKGIERNQENPQEATINRLFEDFSTRFDFYKNNPNAYLAFEDRVTTFTDEEDKVRQAKSLLEAAVNATRARLTRLKILLASGFFKLTQAGQKAAFDGCLDRLASQGIHQNPFRISDEDGEETLLFDELELVIQTLKSIANSTKKAKDDISDHVDDEVGSAILNFNNTFGLNDEEGPTEPKIKLENTFDPLSLDGESTSFPPEEIPAELPAGVADTTSIITLAPKPTRAELSTLHQKAKDRFFAINREVANIEEAIAKLGWWQLLWEENRQEKVRLQAELQAKLTERELAKTEVKRTKAAIDSHTDAKSTVPAARAIPETTDIEGTAPVATVATEVATQLPEQAPASTHPETPEPTGGFATMAADISQRMDEEKARYEGYIAEAKAKAAQAERDRKALEAARGQKAAALAKAKADLAKMSGVGGFFRSMFNWGEKERLQAEVARLTTELGTAEKALAQAPAQAEHTPGFLDQLRTSTAAQISAALLAGFLAAGAFSAKNNPTSTDSAPTPIASSASIADTTQLGLQPEVVPTNTPEKTHFTPTSGDTVWDSAHDAGLAGKALAQTTNDIAVQSGAHLDANHLHSSTDFHSAVHHMKTWGGYTKVLESAEGQTDLDGFLKAVEVNHGAKVKNLVEANIASTFDPMDAPHAPSMIQAALNAQDN